MRILLLLLSCPLLAQTATYAVFNALTPGLVPSDRNGALMAYDEARGRTLLAGGRSPGNTSWRQDTWEFDGSNWVQITPPTQLNWSRPTRLVYATQRNQILAVSGESSAGGASMQIHAWTGSSWLLQPATALPSRADDWDVAWDGHRGVLVLFGSPFGADTFEWDGNTWRLVATGGPIPRTRHRMVYDEARRRVVLQGGNGYNNAPLTDTWEWNGSYWLERFGITPPGSSTLGAIAYDRRRQRVVLHGGYSTSGTAINGVFEYDGNGWTTVTTSGAPSRILEHCMVYEPRLDKMLLFGGYALGTQERTRTIAFVTGTVAGIFPHQAGCMGPNGIPALGPVGSSRPTLGSTFALRFTNLPPSPLSLVFGALGTSDQSWSGGPLPADLTPLGFTGCMLHIDPAANEVLSNTSGTANWNIPLPSSSSLDGAGFFLQGLVLTPGFNPGGAVLSQSRRCVAGLL